jgi:protein phosphatase
MLTSPDISIPRWNSFGLSDVGLVRSSNQDAFVVDDDLGLWVVADGMGGRAGGNVASGLTVKAVLDFFKDASARGGVANPGTNGGEISLQMRQAIQQADDAIRGKALEEPFLAGMATTIVAVAVSSLSPLHVIVCHVGDSRAYLYHDHALRLLTRDHSLVEDLLKGGHISPEEIANHPQRHVLVRALGIIGQAEPDLVDHAIQPDDVLLLCTDGITKMLDHSELEAQMNVALNSPKEACQRLVSQANVRGGKDNSTAVIIRFA